ncbi:MULTISPECIES: thiamine pyrophosphate-dependent dehydrogenase E1 component subunit alpha [unclassified Frigoribacterium]|jgi:pyruvate dehydrogenase E1 component alpha subunit|uniref:thiamine pyrophosphate-dependent dehydrogenase E1 component subunit alpha n=1 Tax=unclassified Frigoribacterium TaxID=2627005 RepID=UPI000F4A2398|nr:MULTISPECIES: thiamine pyrophosphate-dependent dehydrogenase E1 component subunit alpha [unclassified Frigoribacterium]MBD8585847.1 thiamine pyrophosphate-dependent dehydrogenase E1 component subunit alpha [Frigoribacterium sp. CFBP 8766]MBD8611376.1 thiamine pyrophosphate-dependent dehydrogenase E1 component subunit alpha [Frigoribacterium sp. CFBP 13729]ROP73525.1 pyruvate dehydrogenase E1 component alpha subunit [Frigoribacterium sp. PhB107]TDT63077.1 pyruvate dehydrogenase E1 component a
MSPSETSRRPGTVQLLTPAGELVRTDDTAEFLPWVDALSDDQLRAMHRDMVLTRRFDREAAALARQGQLALWVPSHGQEGAQVGLAHATRPQDHLFPSYREHAVALARGVDPVDILRLLRGHTHGGWVPAEHQNFHVYTLVIGSQTLHATGYAMGLGLDGKSGTGDPEVDQAVVTFFGDGATSQGDVSEAMVFATSFQTPELFFLQNNQWAISVPVSRQSRTPLVDRAAGFGLPATQIDGNDVLASYAVSRRDLDAARSGSGPRFIEAMTYRIGAHTSSDDPSKYRTDDELQGWIARDPIDRFAAFLRSRGEGDAFFAGLEAEGDDLGHDVRTRTTSLPAPDPSLMFEHVYSEPHPVMREQHEWLTHYEQGLGGDAGSDSAGGRA